jgi:enamine deaminase RidA (YjgF/YER057c/UK114 family)
VDRIEAHLKALGIVLPGAPAAVANYVPALVRGDLLFVSGQLPMEAGRLKYAGRIGKDLTVEDGARAARLAAINVLAQVKALGALDRVTACLRLGVFVAAAPGFAMHPEVANGASDVMVAAFDEKGRHTRSAVGAASLPRNAAVEVEALFALN